MSKIALSSNALGTGTLTIASPNTNTDRTLTLPDNSGTLLSTTSTSVLPKGVPLFNVFSSATTSLPNNTVTRVSAAGVTADTAGCYNTSLSRYTPNISGHYLFTMDIQIQTTINSGLWVVYFVRNGTQHESYVAPLNNFGHSSVSKIFYMNGTTDWMECAGLQGTGSTQTMSAVAFQGVLVRAD